MAETLLCPELDDKIDTTLMFAHYIGDWIQETVSLA